MVNGKNIHNSIFIKYSELNIHIKYSWFLLKKNNNTITKRKDIEGKRFFLLYRIYDLKKNRRVPLSEPNYFAELLLVRDLGFERNINFVSFHTDPSLEAQTLFTAKDSTVYQRWFHDHPRERTSLW